MKIIFICFLFVIVLTSCEENSDSIHLSKELKLSISSTENNINLDWSLMPAESFTQYSIQWSVNKNNWTYLTNIGDYQTTKYTFPKFGLYMTVYFRVIIEYNNNYSTASNIVELNNPDLFNFSVTPSYACWWPEKNIIYVANYSTIEKVHYISKKSVLIQSISQGINNIYLFDYKGVKELYIISQNKILIYNPIDLTKKDEVVFENSIYGLASDDNGHLIVSDYYNISVYDRSTKQIVSSIYKGYYVSLLFLSSKNQIFANDIDYLIRYSLSSNGQISLLDQSNYNYSYGSILKAKNDESYIVRGTKGIIYNSNMELIGTIYNYINYHECNDYTFSSNSIYCCSQESNNIYQLNLPNLKSERRIPVNGIPTFIEYVNNTLYVVTKNSYDNWGNYVYSLESYSGSK